MKFKFTSWLVTILCATALTSQQSFAQAPTITSNVSIPTGNGNSRGIAYGNSLYIAILNSGYIYKSSDGASWTKVVDAGIPAGTFNCIAFGAGTFVVVGNDGLILSSANGLNWTTRTSSTTEHLTDVKFFGSAFYAVGMNTALRTSTNGTTWSSITLGTGTATDMFLSITYGAGQYVISSRTTTTGSFSYIYRSATGTSNSWTRQDLGIGLLNRVQFMNNKFFAFVAGHQVYTSTNASTWTDATPSITLTLPNATAGTWNSSNQIFNGFYDGTKYYFFGCSQYYSGYGSVWTSTTGTDLTLLTRTAYIVPQGSAYLNGKYFQVGNEGLVYSNDGITFRYPSGNYNSIASNGTGYVGVGPIGGSLGVIFTSSDFDTWTEKTPVGQKELYGVVYTGTKYFAIGNNTAVESTDNGNTWTQVATPAATYTYLAWGNSTYVATGWDNGGNAVISYSTNGTSWTTASTANNNYFKVKYVNGRFFALGYNNDTYLGVILSSTDGISWTDITPNLSFPVYYFNDVVYDGSKFHFMGMEWIDPDTWAYDEFFSISTATVTDANSFANKGTISSPPVANLGGNYGEGAFAYSSGRFAGSINDANNGDTYVIYSTDGVNWTVEAINEKVIIAGAIAETNKFRLLGSGDGKITVDFGGITLPVKLTYFNASLMSGQSLLEWGTAGEQNSHHFTVQYSTDAVSWRTIGTVMAAGNSQNANKYHLIHSNPEKGYNYYRLVQADADGREFTSDIRSIYIGKGKKINVYPNPAGETVQLQLPSTASSTISLFTLSGQQVYQQVHSGNSIKVSLQQLPKGIYQLTVQQDGEKYSQKLYHQ